MSCLWAAVFLAQEVGKGLATREVLLRTLPQKQAEAVSSTILIRLDQP